MAARIQKARLPARHARPPTPNSRVCTSARVTDLKALTDADVAQLTHRLSAAGAKTLQLNRIRRALEELANPQGTNFAPAVQEPQSAQPIYLSSDDADVVPSAAPLVKEFRAEGYDATPFAQEINNPPVIISYATGTDSGRGEQHMWAVGNVLRREGVSVFNAKFTNEIDWQ